MSRALSRFCPAKINLFLAVTGRRGDGFHDLVSLVSPLELGDELHAELIGAGSDVLLCSDRSIPDGADNLVMKAAAAFRRRHSGLEPVRFTLEKRVPAGSGLGGGSSDAASALMLMNQLAGDPLTNEELAVAAAEVGSDCALFLHEGPVVIRGRGERVEALPSEQAEKLRGRQLLLIRPHFGISTVWAYQELAREQAYDAAADAEAAVASAGKHSTDCWNSFERVVFRKYPVYRVLNQALTDRGLPCFHLSGSGSAAFAFAELHEQEAMKPVLAEVMGKDVLLWQTSIR